MQGYITAVQFSWSKLFHDGYLLSLDVVTLAAATNNIKWVKVLISVFTICDQAFAIIADWSWIPLTSTVLLDILIERIIFVTLLNCD